jgi:hypothetical protein
LRYGIQYEQEYENNETRKRTLQQVTLQMLSSELAVEIQFSAPPIDGAKCT